MRVRQSIMKYIYLKQSRESEKKKNMFILMNYV